MFNAKKFHEILHHYSSDLSSAKQLDTQHWYQYVIHCYYVIQTRRMLITPVQYSRVHSCIYLWNIIVINQYCVWTL